MTEVVIIEMGGFKLGMYVCMWIWMDGFFLISFYHSIILLCCLSVCLPWYAYA